MWGENLTKTEGFEKKATSTTYNSTVTISEDESDCGIGWSIYYGTVSTNDKISGNNSAQMRYYSSSNNRGYVQNTTPIEGLSHIAFKARVSSTDIKMTVSYSANASAWTALATNVAFTETGKGIGFAYDVPEGGKYIKIEIGDGSTKPSSGNVKFIVDDVVFTYPAPTPAISVEDEDGDPITALDFGTVKQYTKTGDVNKVLKSFNLKGENLTGNVNLSFQSSNFKFNNSLYPTGLNSLSIAPTAGKIDTTITAMCWTNQDAAYNTNLIVSSATSEFTEQAITTSIIITATYSVKVAVNDEAMGEATVNGEASVYADSEDILNLEATPKPGYEFVNWTYDHSNATLDADDAASTTALTSAGLTITANFAAMSCTSLAAPGQRGSFVTYWSINHGWTLVENAVGYRVNVKQGETPVVTDSLLGASADGFLALNLEANTSYTITVMAIGDGATYCDDNNAVYEATYTTRDYPAAILTLSENGVERILPGEHKVNDVVTLPTEVEHGMKDKVFVGWSRNPVYETDTKPTDEFYEPGAEFTLNHENFTLRAVYAKEEAGDPANDTYKLVSSLTAGKKYVFASANVAGDAYALPAKNMITTAASPVNGVAITISMVNEVATIATVNADLEYYLEAIMPGGGDTLALQVVEDPTNYLCINGSGFNKRASGYKAFWNNGLYGTNSGGSTKYYAEVDGSTFKKGSASTSKPVYAFERTSAVSYSEYCTQEPIMYYITGPEELTGCNWAINCIAVRGDTYTFNALAANTEYKFKVTDGSDWNTAKGFYNLNPHTAGIYTDNDGNVCFKLAEAGDVTVTYIADNTFTVVGNFAMPTIQLKGSWDWDAPIDMTIDGGIATCEVTLNAASNYEFGFVLGGFWTANNYNYHKDYTTTEGVTGQAGNMKLLTDGEGKYIFTWTFENNVMSITFPGAATAIDQVAGAEKPVKVLRDGMIFIQKDGKVYTVTGRLVK